MIGGDLKLEANDLERSVDKATVILPARPLMWRKASRVFRDSLATASERFRSAALRRTSADQLLCSCHEDGEEDCLGREQRERANADLFHFER